MDGARLERVGRMQSAIFHFDHWDRTTTGDIRAYIGNIVVGLATPLSLCMWARQMRHT